MMTAWPGPQYLHMAARSVYEEKCKDSKPMVGGTKAPLVNFSIMEILDVTELNLENHMLDTFSYVHIWQMPLSCDDTFQYITRFLYVWKMEKLTELNQFTNHTNKSRPIFWQSSNAEPM